MFLATGASTIPLSLTRFSGLVLESDVIETGLDADKTKWSSSNLSYWYNGYFLAFGFQKIKNKEDKSVKRKRRVMYMSKVKYQ